MTAQGWLQIAIYLAVLTALTPLLGGYMARVYRGERTLLDPVLGPVERGVYRVLGVNTSAGQDWRAYAKTTIVFSALFWLVLYVILRTQGIHPFNPEDFDSGTWDVTFNTTSSFVSNTNWQFYGGETTMTYFSQMAGLAVQNFVSAAVGMAVLAAVIRGFASRGKKELGNFWQDLVRSLLYILLPLAVIGALILVSQGVVQTLSGYLTYPTVAGGEQSLALGPVASQISIKQLGTNGGGFFNVNSTMPFENATAFTNFVEMLFILLDPGRAHGHVRAHGRQPPPGLGAVRGDDGDARGGHRRHLRGRVGALAGAGRGAGGLGEGDGTTGGNLEGKEQRYGIANTALWATATTAASNGSVNGAHDSFTGLGGVAPLVNMMTGEVIFGGVGSGLYGMLLFVLLAVFIAGLDGGPDARVPRQEDRGEGGQAHDDRHALRAAGRAGLHRARAGHQVRRAVDLQLRARRASPRPSTPTRPRATTTARRSRASPASCSPTRRATWGRSASRSPTCSAASRCSSPASCP